MGRILAIEADPERKRLLTTLIHEHVRADLTIADSVRAAIAIIAERVPDLILTPPLLSPPDEATLLERVKQLQNAPHLQMLTMPALDMLVEPPIQERRALDVFRRRRERRRLQYDPRMVGAQIADCLERARAMHTEHEASLIHQDWLAMSREPSGEPSGEPQTAILAPGRVAGEPVVPALDPPGESLEVHRQADDRRCAQRIARGDVPWLSGIKLSWGVEVHLVNISSSGVLVESGSKLTPGSTFELHLTGPGTYLVVEAHFVRSEVARIDARGVRYHAAAAFKKALDFVVPHSAQVTPSSPSRALADLLATVLAESGHQPEPAQVRFARGLRKLVRARDVLVRNAPIAPADDSESIYFHVSGDGRSRAILQVMFERDRALTESEFRLLKAAALLMAAVLELEKRPRRSIERPATLAPLQEAICEVA